MKVELPHNLQHTFSLLFNKKEDKKRNSMSVERLVGYSRDINKLGMWFALLKTVLKINISNLKEVCSYYKMIF